METWRHAWRVGFAPLLSTPGLEALRDALLCDDPRLLQGWTSSGSGACEPVEGACPVAYSAWRASPDPEGFTAGDAEEAFARLCCEADQGLGEPAGCRWFLNWFDETPRDEVRRELLAEIGLELARRAAPEESQT